MSTNTQQLSGMQAFLRQVGSDRAFMLFFIICLIKDIPYLFLGSSPELLTTYTWLETSLIVLPGVVIFLLPWRPGAMSGNERGFWTAIALSFCVWWLISFLNLLRSLGIVSVEDAFFTDASYLVFYVAWLIALGFLPHRALQRTRCRDHWES